MKKIYCLLFGLLVSIGMASAQSQTYCFAHRDTCDLYMDVYKPNADSVQVHPQTLVYVFGGGFIMGKRNSDDVIQYCQAMAREGYTMVAIDYRLGLKGVKKVGATHTKPLDMAIHMAVEDLFSAVKYLLDNSSELDIDPTQIVITGGSAGAITCLQADYELCNRTSWAQEMPTDFRFAGVIPFAGAIFSREGKVEYKVHNPAPTMFLHGTADKLVNYKQIKVFNLGFFGAYPLAKRFSQMGYPYMVVRFVGIGHQVAAFSESEIERTLWFIEHYIDKKEPLTIDISITDPTIKVSDFNSFTAKDLYGE